jgi:glucose-6-phosphate 1-dehydrogenase
LLRWVCISNLIKFIFNWYFCAEKPVSLSAEDIRNKKVEVLKVIPPVELKDVVLGQYTANQNGQGYLGLKRKEYLY